MRRKPKPVHTATEWAEIAEQKADSAIRFAYAAVAFSALGIVARVLADVVARLRAVPGEMVARWAQDDGDYETCNEIIRRMEAIR